MKNDDFLLDQLERSQLDQTRRRRHDRSRRRQIYGLAGLILVVAVAIGTPSLISHSSMGRSLFVSALANYGIDASVESVRIGWITPLRVTGLRAEGQAGSELMIEQLDMDLTVTDFLHKTTAYGETTLRGVELACLFERGQCSIETDLRPLLEPSSKSSPVTALVKLQDIQVLLVDRENQRSWQISQSNAEVDLQSDQFAASFAGVLSERSGNGGAFQGRIEQATTPGEAAGHWKVEIDSESLPLSVVTLVRRRFPEAAGSIPQTLQGDATGGLVIASGVDGAVRSTIRDLNIRNLRASEEGRRLWKNDLATLDGDLILVDNRVIGRQLQASTDFATTTIDGAFSRNFSLVGSRDNPLRWLEAIEGTATAEIDLAELNRSLPGLLPLRDDVELVSGGLRAKVDSSREAGRRTSHLTVRSEAVRARTRERLVSIDPMELVATVSNLDGRLTAETFRWKSVFGSAVGSGDWRRGNADFDIDFGRLSAVLRPVMDLSDGTLAGTARGRLNWNASQNQLWRLDGVTDATDLLVRLPGGQTVNRRSMKAQVEAVGRWNADGLEELSEASVTMTSADLNLSATLESPVSQPSTSIPMPLRIRGGGRIQTLRETLGPWLPDALHDAAGNFTLSAAADVSSQTSRLKSAAIELVDAEVAWNDRHFFQPNVKIHFDGEYAWPARHLHAQSFTVAGDAFSMAAKGVANDQQLDMTIKWRAKLERIQGSVKKSIAARPSPPVRQVSYRAEAPVQTELWLVMGDCDGTVQLKKREHLLDVDLQTNGRDLSLIQPTSSSARSQTVGPPRPDAQGQLQTTGRSRIVWAEPNLKLDGALRYDTKNDQWLADAVQLSGDWLATTLSGRIQWNDQNQSVQLNGPSRLKMDQVAALLADLSGVDIRAEGIHETPLEIRLQRAANQELEFNVSGELGWESAQVAGLGLSRASVPVRLNETTVSVDRSRIPVGQGSVTLAGQVHYRPGPLWIRAEPGTSAESIRLTPELTERWLKYLAPLIANSTQIEGVIGAQVDEAVIVVEQPAQSRVRGRLNVGGINMNAGPLAQSIVAGIRQLRSLSRPIAGPPAPLSRQLVTIPPQTVQFTVDQGIVSHDRLFFEVDRAQVVTSGQVNMDGRLNLVAQVPLDARWLGRDLQGLAGQPVTLPIDGTLSQPSLDSAGVRQVLTQLGAQAVQDTAENYLQQQLNRGLERIFGR